MKEKGGAAGLQGRTENGTFESGFEPTLSVVFYRSASGSEPVLNWLKSLSPSEKRTVGEELRTVQIGWPLGMPLVRKMESGLWEARVTLANRIARILFTVAGREMVLLHAFIKKSSQTPKDELELARKRMKAVWTER